MIAKIKYLLVFSLLLFVFSCKQDVIIKPPTLVGKWYEKKLVIRLYANGTLVTDSTSTAFTAADFLQFNNDGTGAESASDTASFFYKSNFNFVIHNSVLTLTQYAKDSNTVITTPYNLTSISANDLVLHIEGTYAGAGNVAYRKTGDLYFSR